MRRRGAARACSCGSRAGVLQCVLCCAASSAVVGVLFWVQCPGVREPSAGCGGRRGPARVGTARGMRSAA
eukprot:6377416-Prymnesium_polylepis.1